MMKRTRGRRQNGRQEASSGTKVRKMPFQGAKESDDENGSSDCDQCDAAHIGTNTEPPAADARRPLDALAVGDILWGRYRLEEVKGYGGFGIVWRALDTQLERRVALKIPRFKFLLSCSYAERVLAEARLLAHLHHPSIVNVLEVIAQRRTRFALPTPTS